MASSDPSTPLASNLSPPRPAVFLYPPSATWPRCLSTARRTLRKPKSTENEWAHVKPTLGSKSVGGAQWPPGGAIKGHLPEWSAKPVSTPTLCYLRVHHMIKLRNGTTSMGKRVRPHTHPVVTLRPSAASFLYV